MEYLNKHGNVSISTKTFGRESIAIFFSSQYEINTFHTEHKDSYTTLKTYLFRIFMVATEEKQAKGKNVPG